MKISYFTKQALLLASVFFIVITFNLHAQTYNIITVAGGGIGDGYAATSAVLLNPQGIAADASGNVYIADYYENRIRKVTPAGIITTVAGNGTAGFSGDGGAATAAELYDPYAVAVDASGNIYIADSWNYRIREVNTSGIISTIAGSGTSGNAGNGGPATAAKFNIIEGIAVSGSNVYIADPNGNVVRVFTVGGNINAFAGTGTAGFSGDLNAASNAQLNQPYGVAADGSGNVYIGDASNNRIRKVSGGVISTIAGTGTAGFSGDGGAASGAQLHNPAGISVDAAGDVFIADFQNYRVRKITGSTITTIAGDGTYGINGDGGLATAAELEQPCGVAVSGTLVYIVDGSTHVRVVNGSNTISTYAGGGAGDGDPATDASINVSPPPGNTSFAYSDMVTDASGDVFFADVKDNRIREINSAGIITTVAGNGTAGFTGDGNSATNAELNSPHGIAIDGSGNLYITDTYNQRVRKVSGGIITTIAGTGTGGFSGDGSSATGAQVNAPGGITVDATGNVYFADYSNNRIRKISTAGIITTIAGNGTAGFTGDGSAATSAELNEPADVKFDASGNIYITDYGNARIRKISGGIISTIAGNGTNGYTGDGGAATAAELNWPAGITIVNGEVYIADELNNRLRRINKSGIIQTIAGDATAGYSGDGGAATAASLSNLSSVAMDSTFNIYISDNYNNRIRKLTNSCSMTMGMKGNSPTCYGGNNGNVTATPSGGTSPFTYLWSNGTTNQTASNLTAGTYTCTATDLNGCNATSTYAVANPPQLRDSANFWGNASCYGSSNGFGAIAFKNGTPPFTYAWSPGGYTTDTVRTLAAGSYTATITDANGCNANITLSISQPTALSTTATTNNTSCALSNGSATATAAGGTPPYSYDWSTKPAQTASTADGLAAGTYTLIVTDGNGCTASTNATILGSSGPAITATFTNSACSGSNGKAKVTVTGGTPPFRYYWNNGDTLSADSNMAAGSYLVTVTDINGCSSFIPVNIQDAGGPVIAVKSITKIKCYGDTNGAITISVTGGTSPYQYVWSNSATTANIKSLSVGPYGITVTDATGCEATQNINLAQPSQLYVSTANGTTSTCSKTDGAVSASASGGTLPYLYKWNTGSTTTSLSNLAAGTYTVTVADSNGCTYAAEAEVNNPSAPTIAMDTIADMNCALNTQGHIIMNATGGSPPFSCLWSNGDTSQNIYNLGTGNYSVKVFDAAGCIGTGNANITTSLPGGVSICMVTVDPANNLNTLEWDATDSGRIAKYIIYKETTTPGIFNVIGSSPGNLGQFIDTASNSNYRSWAYEISELDSCGQSSPISESILFKTIHLTSTITSSKAVDLVWDNFQGATFSYYIIYRDSIPGIASDSIGWVSNNTYGYVDHPSTAKNWYYHVGIGGTLGCAKSIIKPHGIEGLNYNASKSNTGNINFNPTGIQNVYSVDGLEIYPNPTRGVFSMNLYLNKQESINVSVYNELGQLMTEEHYGTQTGKVVKQYDLSNYSKGVYLLKVSTDDGVEFKKIVVQ